MDRPVIQFLLFDWNVLYIRLTLNTTWKLELVQYAAAYAVLDASYFVCGSGCFTFCPCYIVAMSDAKVICKIVSPSVLFMRLFKVNMF